MCTLFRACVGASATRAAPSSAAVSTLLNRSERLTSSTLLNWAYLFFFVRRGGGSGRDAGLELRTEVGIPEQMDVIKRVDFEAITQQAIQEGATYPVPRLLESESVMQILNNIAVPA